jgi:hypothetical protein
MSAYTDLIANPYARRRYLVELEAYDPTTGTRTNLVKRSHDFTGTNGSGKWYKYNTAYGAGADWSTYVLNSPEVIDPDGNYNSIKVTTVTNSLFLRQDSLPVYGASTTYTVSLYIYYPSGAALTITTNNDTWSGSFPVITASASWQRIKVTITTAGVPGTNMLDFETVSTGRTFWIYGIQLETGSSMTGYISTATATVTQTGDLLRSYYSSDGFVSGAADFPQHTYYEGRVRTAMTFTRALFAEGRIGGRSIPGTGVLSLANGDGGLDWLARCAVDGRTCRVLLGGEDFTRAEYGVIFDGTMQGMDFTPTTVDIRLRDWQEYLTRPLLTGTFLGTGTWEGTATMTGQPKPRVYGYARNIEPVLIDAANLRYLYHDAAVGGTRTLNAVYDKGVLLTGGGVGYTNTAASGGFVLAAAPAGTITCDVTGPNLSAGAIGEEIVTTAGGLVSGDLDAASVTAFKALVPATVSYYARDQVNCDDALDEIFTAVGSYWGFDRAGLMDMGRLDAPDVSAVAALTSVEVLSFERQSTRLPVWSLSLSYRRNWHPFSLTDLASQFQPGGISASSAAAFTDEWKSLAPATDTAVALVYLLAEKTELLSLLDDSTAAATERDRLFALDKVARDVYRVVAKTQPFQRELGETISLTLSRYNLSGGKNFRIISMTEDSASNRVELEVWG